MRSKIKRYEDAATLRALASLKATRFDVETINPEIFK